MHHFFAPTIYFLLNLWLVSALLTFLVHLCISLAIDRCFAPGLWEQWALAVFMILGPFGLFLEFWLVLGVWRDIRSQHSCMRKFKQRKSTTNLRDANSHPAPSC